LILQGGGTVKDFCATEVEPMFRESDHIHIIGESRMRSRGGLIKFPPEAGDVITNYGSGSLLFFIKDLKNIILKSHGCINPCKKVGTVLKLKKVIFKVSVIKRHLKAEKMFLKEPKA
jgi:hypothetical protein